MFNEEQTLALFVIEAGDAPSLMMFNSLVRAFYTLLIKTRPKQDTAPPSTLPPTRKQGRSLEKSEHFIVATEKKIDSIVFVRQFPKIRNRAGCARAHLTVNGRGRVKKFWILAPQIFHCNDSFLSESLIAPAPSTHNRTTNKVFGEPSGRCDLSCQFRL